MQGFRPRVREILLVMTGDGIVMVEAPLDLNVLETIARVVLGMGAK